MEPDVDVDILIVGAGVTGLYQLYRAREAGYTAQLVEIRFDTRVTSAAWDDTAAAWLVQADGYAARARYLIAATGVQIIPVIAPEVASLTVYQRTPNWATPLNNRPITPEERQAYYERLWRLGGFGKIVSNYRDMTLNPAANAEWTNFVAGKIRAAVHDPATAGSGTTGGLREFDIIVWATGFDFGTGALNRLGARGRDGLPLEEYWADGPLTYPGPMCHRFPNFFFPGGPHGAAGNNPRYSGDQSDFTAALIDFARERRHPVTEVPEARQDEWTTMVNEAALR